MHTFQPIPEWRGVDAVKFRDEVVPQNRPAVLRNCVTDWPAVREAMKSPQSICDYLRKLDRGLPIQTLVADASIKGRFFYRADMRGLNFERRKEALPSALDRLLSLQNVQQPPAAYIESTPVVEHLPEFCKQNVLPLLHPNVAPRIWIGNAVTVQTHFDLNDNVACVVAGRRRFTLFPPEQLPNLYVGPFDFTLSGPPVSMVSLHEPDFSRYPNFKEALRHAQTAELGPGDALYIPYFWWHHVESLDSFNVLINYWWNPAARSLGGSPFDCLLHAVLTLRDLPPNQRDAWRIVFDHYIFKTHGDPLAHLKPEHRGLLGETTPEKAKQIKGILSRLLSR